jgi:hypothetical protein
MYWLESTMRRTTDNWFSGGNIGLLEQANFGLMLAESAIGADPENDGRESLGNSPLRGGASDQFPI